MMPSNLFSSNDFIVKDRPILLVTQNNAYCTDFKSFKLTYKLPAAFTALAENIQNQLLKLIDSEILEGYYDLYRQGGRKTVKVNRETTQNIVAPIIEKYLTDTTQKNAEKIAVAYQAFEQKNREESEKEMREMLYDEHEPSELETAQESRFKSNR